MKVLFPIDLSEISINALRYAYDLFPQASIQVIHVITGLLDPKDPMVVSPWIPKDISIREEIQRQINNEFKGTKYPQQVDVEVIFGEIVESIRDYAQKHSFDVIVMATRDKYDAFDRIVGTTSLGVIKTTDLPVYLVPRYARFRGFKRILVASDKHFKDRKVIEYLRTWNTQHAFLKFLHVRESEEDTFNDEEQEIFSALFESGEPEFGFEVKVIEDTDIAQSLLSVAYAERMDLIVAIPDRQSFLQALFVQSITKELVQKSSLPMLFLPQTAINKGQMIPMTEIV